MAIRMVHPNHGTTFAVGAEVAWNEKYGWKVEEATVAEPVVEAAVEPVEATRRGRPPKVNNGNRTNAH